MPATRDPHITIRIHSHPRYLCVLRSAVETAAKEYGLDQQISGRVVLAVDEAVANVIRHGYHGQTDKPIWVNLAPIKADGGGIEVVIEDECRGVDLSRIRGRDLKDVKPGGLGVHILREIMDEVEYRHRESHEGVRLTMRKRASPATGS